MPIYHFCCNHLLHPWQEKFLNFLHKSHDLSPARMGARSPCAPPVATSILQGPNHYRKKDKIPTVTVNNNTGQTLLTNEVVAQKLSWSNWSATAFAITLFNWSLPAIWRMLLGNISLIRVLSRDSSFALAIRVSNTNCTAFTKIPSSSAKLLLAARNEATEPWKIKQMTTLNLKTYASVMQNMRN